MKNGDKMYLNICLDGLSYNELMELFKAVREEIKRRENETPIFVKDNL
jgi:hypothetical protein